MVRTFGETGLGRAHATARRVPDYFTLWFMFALAAGLAAAVLLAPFAAAIVAAASLHIPFPRIFDRTVMVTIAAALLWFARPLDLVNLLHDGFADPRQNWRMIVGGLALAVVAIAILFLVAFALHGAIPMSQIATRAVRYLAAAATIALIEEGFFRAFLLGGMLRDFSRPVALGASSAIFATVHLVRSPARFYLTGFHPAAGLTNLAASASRIVHPGDAVPMVAGLFLLGLVLGTAYLRSARAWFSAGIHAGLVLGAKTWPIVADGGATLPRWLAGPGPVPLIAAPAGWLIAIAMLALLPWLIRPVHRTVPDSPL
jgi:membrane protease YdiL (CAAX protease family)